MQKDISLKEFESIECLLLMLGTLGLADDYTIQWEQRPKLIINQLGDFEFENPQETYGCVITFWECEDWIVNPVIISKTRFVIKED